MTGKMRFMVIPLALAVSTLAGCSHILPQEGGVRAFHPAVVDDGQVDCSECHTDQIKGELKPYQAFSHSPLFVRKHRLWAIEDDALCKACHAEAFCYDCHAREVEVKPSIKYGNRPDREFMHRGDYLTRHMTDGRVDPASCYKCHGRANNEKCIQCHR